MATSTTNFGLKKIDLTDVADITVINENWDKIDEQLLKAGESGGTDLIETEASSIIDGDAPEIDPVVENRLTPIEADVVQVKSDLTEYKGKTDVLESRPVNNNILINSNFANPVNQRGVTAETWVDGEYGIDRWRIANRFTKCSSINDEGLTFYTTDTTHTYNAIFVQRVEASDVAIGETYTLTAYINNALHSTTFVLQATTHQKWINIYGVALEVDASTIASGYIEIRIRSRETTPLTVKWMKLELGDHATPYVPRLYAEELELCKRYFDKYALTLFPYKLGSNSIQFSGDFRNIMRITPTVTANFEMYVNGEMPSGFTFEVGYKDTNNVFFKALKTSHGYGFASGIKLIAYVCVDAEL